MNQNRLNQTKRLELLGGLGAGILGAGVALLLADWLKPYAIPALLLGMVAHGWAMYQKGRLEQQVAMPQPAWTKLTELVCWILLGSLALYIVYQLV